MTCLIKLAVWAIPLSLLLSLPARAADCDKIVTDKLIALYELDTTCSRVEILSNPLDCNGATPDEITILPFTPSEPRGLFTALVRLSNGGEIVQSGQVRWNVRQYGDVVVSSDKIASREPLTPDKLIIKRVEITGLHERPLRSLDEIIGFRARRNLSPGTILTTAAVERVPDIEAGRELTIVYLNGLCRVTAGGLALQPGSVGDYVRVKNTGSGKILLARVVDGTAVAVDP
ncbi:MAG TPA: flagellar basal body P-ring formation chaperone FlgA [Candidatus Deferrimicrobium sp.]|nr:flagellar basal body P-ring formation chaperone FlgA [Candidatus Deferrimicrobium sp.]